MWNILRNILMYWLISVSFTIIGTLVIFGLSFVYDFSSWIWEDQSTEPQQIMGPPSADIACCDKISKKGAKWKKTSKKQAKNKQKVSFQNDPTTSLHAKTPSAPLDLTKNPSNVDPYSIYTSSIFPSSERPSSYSDMKFSSACPHSNKGVDTSDFLKSLKRDKTTSPTESSTTDSSLLHAFNVDIDIRETNEIANSLEEKATSAYQHEQNVSERRPAITIRSGSQSAGVRRFRPETTSNVPSSASGLCTSESEGSDLDRATVAVTRDAAVVVVFPGPAERARSKSANDATRVPHLSAYAPSWGGPPPFSGAKLCVTLVPDANVTRTCSTENTKSQVNTQDTVLNISKLFPTFNFTEQTDSKFQTEPLVVSPTWQPCSTLPESLSLRLTPDVQLRTISCDHTPSRTTERSMKYKTVLKQTYTKPLFYQVKKSTAGGNEKNQQMIDDNILATGFDCTSATSPLNTTDISAQEELVNVSADSTKTCTETPRNKFLPSLTLSSMFPTSLSTMIERTKFLANCTAHHLQNSSGCLAAEDAIESPMKEMPNPTIPIEHCVPEKAVDASNSISPETITTLCNLKKPCPVYDSPPKGEVTVNMTFSNKKSNEGEIIICRCSAGFPRDPLALNLRADTGNLKKDPEKDAAGATKSVLRDAPADVLVTTEEVSPPVTEVAVGPLGVELAKANNTQEAMYQIQNDTEDIVPP